MEKDTLITQLKEILPIMERLDKHLEGLSQMEIHINSLDKQINKPRKINFFSDVAIGGLVLPILLVSAISNTFQIESATIGKLGFALMILGAIANLYVSGKIRNIGKDGIRKDKALWEKKYEEAENAMVEEIAPHWEKVLSVVPQSYANPTCVGNIYGYLVNGRADSLKEALNLFEEEQHRWRVEENQRQMYEEYQQELQAMQSMQANLEQRLADAEWQAKLAYIRTMQNV